MKNKCDIKLYLIFISIIILIIYYIIRNYHFKNNIIKQRTTDNKILEYNNLKIPIHLNFLKLNHIEKFENNENNETSKNQCIRENNLYFIYLSTKHLEQTLYKPEPIWTNDTFCIYKTRPILSLNQTLNEGNQGENNYYYSLGDVILFKDYSTYIKLLGKNNETMDEKKNENNNKKEKEFFMNKEETPLKGDKYIKNYNQPGIKGLKILVKNGRKPVGFSPNPVAKIKQGNGETLWIWEPIAPKGYKFLGHCVSINPNPVVPNIDTCNIRCVPEYCLKEINILKTDIVISKDIIIPNRIYLVSNGKYFKGTKITLKEETDLYIKSHELTKDCIRFEIDENDKQLDINILYKNVKKNSEMNELEPYHYDLFKSDFEKHFEGILLNNPDFLLNNFTNNPDDYFYNIQSKRYLFNSSVVKKNEVGLIVKLKKRKFGYNELKSTDLYSAIFKAITNKKLDFSIVINGKVYNFECSINVVAQEKINIEGNAPSCVNFNSPSDTCLEEDYNKINKLYYGSSDIPLIVDKTVYKTLHTTFTT